MKQKTQRWLLCVVVVLAMVAVFALVACNNTTYKATFVGGDGASGNPPAAIEGKANEEITLPQNTFQRAGYTFAGWNDGTKTYNAGAKYTLTKDVTFTAQWKENETDAPFATAAFDGVLLKFESAQNGVQFVFTSISSGNGRHTMRINTPQDSLVGSYTISEEGNIVIYKNDDAIGEGNIDGKTLTVSAKIGDKQTKVSATGDMYKITISANTQTNDMVVFVNAGAPLFPLLSLLPFGTTDATIEFNDEPFDVDAEEDAFSAGTGYTTMPAQESTVEITIPTPTEPTLHFALGDHAAAGAVAPEDIVANGGSAILPDAVEAEEGWVFTGWEQYLEQGVTGRIYSAGSSIDHISFDVDFVAHYERANAIELYYIYVDVEDDDGNRLYVYGAAGSGEFSTVDLEVDVYLTFSDDDGYTVIDSYDPYATGLQLYTTENTLIFSITYNEQEYQFSVPLYKLTISLEGEEMPFYVNEGLLIGDMISEFGASSFNYEGQPADVETFTMPNHDITIEVVYDEEEDPDLEVDLSKYEGTYIAETPYVIGSYSLKKIVITATDITAYTTTDEPLGLSYTVLDNNPDTLSINLDGVEITMTFPDGEVSLNARGVGEGVFAPEGQGEEISLDEYAGEWEFNPQSVSMGPKEFDGFKVEDGKIYLHSDGSYGDALTPSLSEEGGNVVATVQATQTWEATITFESATSASLEATNSLDTVSATCTKKGSAPAKKTLADYEGTWEGKDASDIGVTSFRIGTDKVEYELDAGPGEYTEFTSYEVDDSGENLVVTCHKTGYKTWDMIITFTSDNKATVEIKSQTSEFTKAGTETPVEDPFTQLIGVWTHDQEQIVISEAGKDTQTDSGTAVGSIIIGGEFVYLVEWQGAFAGMRADYNQISITYADGQVTVSSSVWGDGDEPVVTSVVYGQKQNLNNATLSSFEGIWKITGTEMTFTIGDNITCSNENAKVDGYHIVDKYLVILYTQVSSKYQYVLSRNGDTLSGYYTAPEGTPQAKTLEKQEGTVGGGSDPQPPVTTGKTFVGKSTKFFDGSFLGSTTIVITEITIDTTQIVKTCKIVGTADGKAFDLEVTLENSDLKWYEGEKPAKYFYGFEIKPGTVACAYNLAVLEDGSLLLCGDNGVPLSDGAFTAQ